MSSGALTMDARRIALWTAADYLLVSLGLFSVMSVLARLLAGDDAHPNLTTVGIGLFAYTAMAGVSSLLVNRWISQCRVRVALACSAVLCAVGFGLLPYVRWAPGSVLLLLLAGMGSSVHFQVTRVLIAELFADSIERNKAYSDLQIAVNVAATIGPFLASFLLPAAGDRLLLLVVSAHYLCAAVLVLMVLPPGLSLPATVNPWPVSRFTGQVLLHDSAAVRTVLVTVIGSFLYAQFFSAFALLVAREVSGSLLRGALLAAPAVLIVLLQRLVARLLGRLMRRGVKPVTLLRGGALAFGLAMVPLGSGLAVVMSCFVAAVVFALAEMIFTPMASTAFTALRLGSSLEVLNIRQCAWTAGEALGSLCGGGLFLLLAVRHAERSYWLALAVVAIIGTLLTGMRRSRLGHPAGADSPG